ncbi:hypothetical protein COO91_10847 (plasmid) [Nostoc flagelliforme CCNUN1]|uniref:Uncharacterized protein n=1 Tax=Nostoc flagelliforme CCNUN1 TaxID=2038116 RepID=A0A2K8TAC7_9NOSO|nr:hypothetical protein COO91_10847 [Nostoc flagelliforme CCNUN1]
MTFFPLSIKGKGKTVLRPALRFRPQVARNNPHREQGRLKPRP